MAVNLVPGANFQRNDTALSLPVSVCCWAKFDTFPAAFQTVFYHGTAVYSNCLLFGALDDGSISATDGAFVTRAGTPPLSTGVWYFLAVTVATGTNNLIFYWREEGEASLNSDAGTWAGTFAQNRMLWGTGPGDPAANTHDGSLAYCRMFSGVLTPTQLQAESESATAVATEWADWPMASTATSTTDASGNARSLTFNAGGGSQGNDTDPNISTGGGTVQGTASGIVAVSGTAAGVRRVHGSASGMVATSGAAAGVRRVFGSGSGLVLPSGEAVGQRRVLGSASGMVATSGTATGVGTATARQVSVRVGPTRRVPSAAPGPTEGRGLDVAAGPTRATDLVEPSRSVAAIGAASTRGRGQVGVEGTHTRERVEVGESRQSFDVGPNRQE